MTRASLDDLDDDTGRSRIVAVVLGLTLALGQVVPAWVGRELLLAERAKLVLVTARDAA